MSEDEKMRRVVVIFTICAFIGAGVIWHDYQREKACTEQGGVIAKINKKNNCIKNYEVVK